MLDNDRYQGQPMLRFMDSYVLDAIGVLDQETATSLAEQASTLAEALDVQSGTWQSVVEQAMGMPPDSPQALRDAWLVYQAEFAENGAEADPIAFAHVVVDRAVG